MMQFNKEFTAANTCLFYLGRPGAEVIVSFIVFVNNTQKLLCWQEETTLKR
jgi:hypothetical protein